MKVSRQATRSSARKIPELRFEDQSLTSFSGLVAFQALFNSLNLTERLGRCTYHLRSFASYAPHRVLLLLTVHLILGWKRLRDLDYYRDDPLVLRVVGLQRLPSVAAVSRTLSQFDEAVYDKMRAALRDLVVERIQTERLPTLTLDFDGSVQRTTGRFKEGTAKGYGCKKHQRSYYPCFATVAQTGQVFDVLHRGGNVHDSNGASTFMAETFAELRQRGFSGRLEARFDSAHFNERTCFSLVEQGIEFVGCVPFECLPQLKSMIEERERWRPIDEETSFFERKWKPEKWSARMRFVFYRHRRKVPRRGPVQLDFFEPISTEYKYKVLVTSKKTKARHVLEFYNGRGSQEGIFAELKSQLAMDYMPSKRLIGNKVYIASSLLAHNLNRELQMRTAHRSRLRNTAKRAALWTFEQVRTLRQRIVQRAGRLTRPGGVLTLTCSGNDRTARELTEIVRKLSPTG